jgi:diphthamide biosynthesis methyltransferase
MKTKTNPYQVIIDLNLEADYLSQESCVKLMLEFSKRENQSILEDLKQSVITSEKWMREALKKTK